MLGFRPRDDAAAVGSGASRSNLRGVICWHLLPLASDKVAFEFKYTACLGADGPTPSRARGYRLIVQKVFIFAGVNQIQHRIIDSTQIVTALLN